MKCGECRDKISVYIDEMLTQEESEQIKAHLRTCEQCNEVYKQTYELINHLKPTEDVKLPENFHNQLMSRIKQEKQIDKRKKTINIKGLNYKKLLPIAASVLIGAILLNNDKIINFNTSSSYKSEEIEMANLDETNNMDENIINEQSKVARTIDMDEKVLTTENEEVAQVNNLEHNEWYIETNDKEGFLKQIKKYLNEKKWTYVIDDVSIEIDNAKYQELLEWIQTLEKIENIKVNGDESPPFKIIYGK